MQSNPRNRRRFTIPRVDLTPMVDLGFLLITFFMFTTTLAKPKTMVINMPYEGDTSAHSEIPEEATITLIPVKDHRIIYYKGAPGGKGKSLNWCAFGGRSSVRSLLMNMQHEIRHLPAAYSKEAHLLHVMIKPDEQSKYEDAVGILDEMNILEVPYYFIMDLTQSEKDWMKKEMHYGK